MMDKDQTFISIGSGDEGKKGRRRRPRMGRRHTPEKMRALKLAVVRRANQMHRISGSPDQLVTRRADRSIMWPCPTKIWFFKVINTKKIIYYNLNVFFYFFFFKKNFFYYNLKSKLDYQLILFTNQRKLSAIRQLRNKP